MAEAILRAGHEIGHHGYHHLLPDPGDPWIEEELERGFEALKRRLGVKPTGYRAPYGEFTEELRVALVRHGIVYTSSFRDDVRPYRHRLADGRPGTIELPVTASYDDWMHGLSARFSPRPIFPKEHVLSIWKDELDEVRDWGALEWARPIIDVVFDGSADAVDGQLTRLIDGRYFRLQTRLDEASDDLDDASPENLAALRREAEQLIAERTDDIDRLCSLLT